MKRKTQEVSCTVNIKGLNPFTHIVKGHSEAMWVKQKKKPKKKPGHFVSSTGDPNVNVFIDTPNTKH